MRVLNYVGRLVLVGCLPGAVAVAGAPAAHLVIPADAIADATGAHDDCVIRPVSESRGTMDETTTLSPDAAARAEQDFHQRSTVQQLIAARAAPATINVVVHVIYRDNSRAGGNAPDAQISRQVDVLNTAFSDTGLQFRLVSIDRSLNANWFDNAKPDSEQQREMKNALRKGGTADLNLYTVGLPAEAGGYRTLGWSTLPSSVKQDSADDGVVIAADTLPGGSFKPIDLGINAVHEIGHWVGLYNTFQGGCDSPGDYVDDTPAERSPASGCHEGRDSCPDLPGNDPIHNYMDMSDDACRNQFTPGQITRMRDQLATYRGFPA
ncbi:zinc metalloprotease [Nocardia sp. NPDC060256]|uniref:zinc metalloprotease n=1 Tax=unclassified Nocardia TaxID=2637762 RepID=UPI00365C326A